jgi:molybdopterin converting factor small subunit
VTGLAIGGAILLIGGNLTEGTSVVQETRASLITVKVYYSMMTQYTDLTEEYFVIQSPAVLQDLMNTVVVRHPSMAQMIQLMLTLLNGVPAKPSASLKDRDVIQFIPLSAGG